MSSENTDNLDLYEKVEFLFKNYLGFPNTDKTKPFFQETSITASNYFFGNNVLLDPLPSTPNWSTPLSDGSGTELLGENYVNGSSKIFYDETGVLVKYEKIKLTTVPNSNEQSYYALDVQGNNILKDAIQFNKNKQDDGSLPYLYTLYANDKTTAIPMSDVGGNWVFDIKNGVMNIVDRNSNTVAEKYKVSSDKLPYLTFIRYIGRRGIDKLKTSDINGLDSNTNNIRLEITELRQYVDASLNLVNEEIKDLSNNVDASFNDVYTKAVIDSKLTTLNNTIDASLNIIDASLNQINLEITELTNNVDASFNDVYTKAVIDSKLTTLNNTIDASLNQINLEITELTNNVDASFNDVYTKAAIDSKLTTLNNTIDASLNQINLEITELTNNVDASFNDVYTKATIDTKLTTLNNTIDASLNQINLEITELTNNVDASFNDVYTKATIDTKLTTLNNTIDASLNIIDASLNQINQEIKNLSNNVDASFNDVYTKAAIDSKLTTLNNTIDTSLNIIDASLNQINNEIKDLSNNAQFTGIWEISLKDTIISYNENKKYLLKKGTYQLTNVPIEHPIAILNKLKSSELTYACVSNDDDPIIIKVSGGSNSANSAGDYYTFKDSDGNSLNIGNGDFRFMRGKTYKFQADGISSSHPFKIYMSSSFQNNNSGNSNGISGSSGSITITIPSNHSTSEGDLYYQCRDHSSMKNNLSLFYKSVTGTTSDGSYDFYYGDITITVNDDFGILSVYCFYHGYMGGENILKYTSSNTTGENEVMLANISFTYIVNSNGNKYVFSNSQSNSNIENNKFLFNGPGITDSTNENPELYFVKGQKYKFINNTNQTIRIQKTSALNGESYEDGVTITNNVILFDIKFNLNYSNIYYKSNIYENLGGKITIIDNKNTNSITELRNDIDASLNEINQEITDLSNNVYSKKILDSSFNQINTTITQLTSDVDVSFNDVYTKAVIESKLKDLTSIVDGSLNIIDSSLNEINQEITQLTSDVDSSFNDVYTKAEIESKLKDLTSIVDGSLNIIDASLNEINQEITDLSNTVHNLNLQDLKNVEIGSGLSIGNVLQFNGSNWVPGTVTTSSASDSTSSKVINNSGQTFFEIMTQQPNTFDLSANHTSTSNQITLNWNYSNIIPQPSKILYEALLGFQSERKNQRLPFINEIKVDISGTQDSGFSTTAWPNYRTLQITNDYTTEHTSITIQKTSPTDANSSRVLNILSKNTPIDFRIYGVNHAIDYPSLSDSKRTMIIRANFQEGTKPSKPILSNQSFWTNTLLTTFYVEETEAGDQDSTAKIIKAVDISYNAFETLSSNYIPIVNTSQSIADIVYNPGYAKNTNFPISFPNLRYGTKYKVQTKVENNVSNTASDYSSIYETTNYIDIPESNKNSQISFSVNDDYKHFISSKAEDITNEKKIYIILNYSSSTRKNALEFNNILKEFEISNQDADKSSTQGYGKYIDDMVNLVTVEVNIKAPAATNYITKETLEYSGFKTTDPKSAGTVTHKIKTSSTGSLNTYRSSDNNYSLFENDSPGQEDAYKNNEYKKGFRINGKFSLKNRTGVSNHTFNEFLNWGDSSADSPNPYTLQINVTRNSEVNTTYNSNLTEQIFLDKRLTNDPTIVNTTDDSNNFKINTVAFTMGIPSVDEFDFQSNERTYKYINSENMYIPGNNIIGELYIDDTSIDSSSKIKFQIQTANIQLTGQYTHIFSENNLYYKKSLINNLTEIVMYQTVYSLFFPSTSGSTSNANVNPKHYCDYNSFSINNNGQINGTKLKTKIKQIQNSTGNIGRLGSNLKELITEDYDENHETNVNDWTLLFINGLFHTNAHTQYPNFTDGTFNTTLSSNSSLSGGIFSYNAGEKSYLLDGTQATSNNGYKWIVFKIPQNSNNTAFTFINQLGSSTNSPISIKSNGTADYISFKDLFENLFQTATLDKLVNESNTEVIGFCRANTTITGNTSTKVGSFKKPWSATKEWTSNGTSQTSYSNLNNNNGCIVKNGDDYGIYVNITVMSDDLEIFIGLQNNVSL